MGHLLKLLKAQRAVVEGGLEAEAVVHQVGLARLVATIHGTDLRHGHMALVDDGEEVVGKEVQQAERTHAGLTPVEVARVILDARAVAHLANHLQVVGHALIQALGLDGAVLAAERLDLGAQVHVNLAQCLRQALLGGHEDVGGEDAERLDALAGQLRQRVEQLHRLDLVAPEDDAQHDVLVAQVDIDRVALDAEVAHLHVDLVARVERVDQLAQEHVTAHGVRGDVLGVAHAVEARHARHHHDVAPPAQQCCHCGQAQPLNLLVDGQVFLDILVGGGDVGLGLVVVIVADEVVHRVLGEEAFELAVELRRQRLVVRQHQRGAAGARDDIGHRERLARAGHAQQGLELGAGQHAVGQLADGLRLVARRRIL